MPPLVCLFDTSRNLEPLQLLVIIGALALFGFWLGKRRALAFSGGREESGKQSPKLHSRPEYYGGLVALWAALPAILVLGVIFAVRGPLVESAVMTGLTAPEVEAAGGHETLAFSRIKSIALGELESDDRFQASVDRYVETNARINWYMTLASVALGAVLLIFTLRRLRPRLRARSEVEWLVKSMLLLSSMVAIVSTIGIVFSVLFEALRFFGAVSPIEFLFGTTWSPQTAIRADQVGSSGAFGAVPLFAGTLLITVIAMLVAVPLGLCSAIYLAEYASNKVRSIAKPLLEVLAGIPTVVYGFFAALTVAPFLRDAGVSLGLDVSSESALAAGLVMGIMIIPFISSLSDDVINAVPQSLREGSQGLGATRSETIRKVILPAALPGIVGGALLAVSRAIGETMIVVMAAGLAANLTANPLESVTTVTVQIVTLLVGDQEFDSPKTLAAFALGLVLFISTLILNVIALYVVRRYREQYD